MSGYVIDDVPTAQVRSDASDVLGGSDSIQESLIDSFTALTQDFWLFYFHS